MSSKIIHDPAPSVAQFSTGKRISHIATAVAIVLGTTPVFAASFTINSAQTAKQTLATGETGTITASGSLTVNSGSSGSDVAVTITGNNATLTNLGILKQTGTGRAIRDNTGVTALTVTNGSSSNSAALMQTSDADVIQMNKANSNIVFYNYGTLNSLNTSKGGAQAIDFNAMTGSNVLYNYAGGLIQAQDADAVRPGVNGIVHNYGTIKSIVTSDTGSDGIDAQNNTGVTVNNYAGGVIIGARHGITGGAVNSSTAFTTTINNNGSINGNNGSGINLDGFNALQTATIVNSGSIVGNGVTGDGDGIDVDGVVNITNTGVIRSMNSFSSTAPAQSEGITVGGGTIINSGTIEGLVSAGNSNAVGRGITLAGVDTSGTPEHIYANSIVTNQAGGLIKGQNDSAIAVGGPASGFTIAINNNAGATISGGGTNAAILTGADNDTINNAGTIISNGKAINMGAGDNVLHITGGTASITGDIDGGVGGTNVMTINPGNGNTFSYSGVISHFNDVGVLSGTVSLSGNSNYSGTTTISGGRLVLNGANRLSSASSLSLSGGTLEITDAAGINGQTFDSLTLDDNSILQLDGSMLTFNNLGGVAAGKALSVLEFYQASSSDYAFRLLGDHTHDDAFLVLIGETTINGVAATLRFDGTYTNVSATPLPAAVILLLSGLGGLGFTARRRAA